MILLKWYEQIEIMNNLSLIDLSHNIFIPGRPMGASLTVNNLNTYITSGQADVLQIKSEHPIPIEKRAKFDSIRICSFNDENKRNGIILDADLHCSNI